MRHWCVEPAAQTDFEDRDGHAATTEQLKRGGCRDFEERRNCPQPAAAEQIVCQSSQILDDRREGVLRNRCSVDEIPFGQVNQVRGRITSRLVTGCRQRSRQHGADRSFPVRAGDDDRGIRVLRAPEGLRDGADVVEAQFVAVELEAEEILEGIHGRYRNSGFRIQDSEARRPRATSGVEAQDTDS
jgi:hypothetical protein